MPLSTPVGGSLGTFNVGLSASLGLLNPLSAQLDLLLALGLGPFMADLSAQFNMSLALQATLTLQISDPTAALRAAIAAIMQLIAALQAALQLPTISVGLSAELSASFALAAALSLKLGGLKLLIEAALAIKIAAMKFAADMAANLTLPGAAAFSFSGDAMSTTGSQIQSLFSSTLVGIQPTAVVYGVVLLTALPAVSTALSAIITV